ncbi:unnamed protein product [Hermetia illucens]|uniref:Uncharacterized protein n=1 Tax=Hermetia illucens TaxID=343691 RepID=A0A7R8YVG7_HERIL|nr:unnamed protein product [Hermetia illucens]
MKGVVDLEGRVLILKNELAALRDTNKKLEEFNRKLGEQNLKLEPFIMKMEAQVSKRHPKQQAAMIIPQPPTASTCPTATLQRIRQQT